MEAKAVVRENIDGEPWLYLTALYRAEVGLAQSVHRIASATPHPLPKIDVEKAIVWVEGKLGIKLATGQQEAIRQACQHKMMVITGGPGVGKTTLVRSILEIFAAKKLSASWRLQRGERPSGWLRRQAKRRKPSTASWSSIRPRANSSGTSNTRSPATCSSWTRLPW